MDLTPLYVVGAATIRSISGWAENALADKKIQDFEWKQLIATIIRVGLFGAIIGCFPGFDISWISASAVALAVDFIYSTAKKFKK